VTVPVRLYTAVSRKSVRFNQLDQRTGSRIKRKWVSALDGEEVPNDELVRGYEITAGNFVTISDEELSSLDPEASRTIDIVEFVDLDEIEPLMYDNQYYLEPDELAAKAYKVLLEALTRAEKVAIARIVMRNKEYLAAVRPSEGVLVLSTMVYADEVNEAAEIDGIAKAAEIEVSDAEIEMAEQLIGTLEADFDADKYSDGYRERVLEMIQRKADGEEVIVQEDAAPAASAQVVDLMAALEASVAAAKESRAKHPTAKKATKKAQSKGTESNGTGSKKKSTKKSVTKKAASKKAASHDSDEPEAKTA